MGIVEGLRGLELRRIWLVVIAFVPYVDQEVLGSIPLVRDIAPYTEPYYWLELDWTERAKLILFILIPYVDGEIIELLGGDARTFIED